MNVEAERERLMQTETLRWLRQEYRATDMVTVYQSDREGLYNRGIYCALIPSSAVEDALSTTGWDLIHGGGVPGASVSYANEEPQATYLRYGSDDGVEPLVIDREFHGMRDNYRELGEEFRLFHNLYHDVKANHYIKIDEAGNEHTVATVDPTRIQIRLLEIRQFLAIKEMYLSIQFDHKEFSRASLDELGLSQGGDTFRDGLACWGLHFGELSPIVDKRGYSRLLGKRLIGPMPKVKSGFEGFSEELAKQYVDFIIDVDENGEAITHTSNPDTLGDHFGGNPDAPHFLTPVHFRSEVLEKYYQQPAKYTVEDSLLRCGYLWHLYIDNHHDNQVVVWLGDLGESLPYEEMLHWKAHNILPHGSASETYIRRQILSQFTDSSQLEHVFGYRYDRLQQTCSRQLGWQLLLPLAREDVQYLQSARIPATNEQRLFDELVLGLTKVLIESLNEKELKKLLPADKREGIKGSISRLETVLESRGLLQEDGRQHFVFLRALQDLRSTGSAHRKGKSYRDNAAGFGIETQTLRDVFTHILTQSVAFLDYLIEAVESGRLNRSND